MSFPLFSGCVFFDFSFLDVAFAFLVSQSQGSVPELQLSVADAELPKDSVEGDLVGAGVTADGVENNPMATDRAGDGLVAAGGVGDNPAGSNIVADEVAGTSSPVQASPPPSGLLLSRTHRLELLKSAWTTFVSSFGEKLDVSLVLFLLLFISLVCPIAHFSGFFSVSLFW